MIVKTYGRQVGDAAELHGGTTVPARAAGRQIIAATMATMGHEAQPREGCIHVVIEIPRGSRNKYEIDHDTGHVFLDRRLFTATTYPADYGFIPDTLGEDGDPLDALVLLEDPVVPGRVGGGPAGRPACGCRTRPGPTPRSSACRRRSPAGRASRTSRDLPEELLEEIKHFFDVYKALEPGKMSTTQGFEGRKAAWREIEAANGCGAPATPEAPRREATPFGGSGAAAGSAPARVRRRRGQQRGADGPGLLAQRRRHDAGQRPGGRLRR